MPEERMRSSLRRSRSPGGILLLLCLVLAAVPNAAAQAPAPDPAPGVSPTTGPAPDPLPVAPAQPPPAARVAQASQPSLQPPAVPPVSTREAPVKPARRTAVAKPKAVARRPALVVSEPRDSVMPAAAFLQRADALERSRLVLAGLALALVALGGAVVLGVGSRALAEARA